MAQVTVDLSLEQLIEAINHLSEQERRELFIRCFGDKAPNWLDERTFLKVKRKVFKEDERLLQRLAR